MSRDKKIASRSQLLGLGGQLVQHMPADLSVEVAQEWANDPDALAQFLADLRDGPFPIDQVKVRRFEVVIDPKRTVEQWVAAGKYSWFNEHHTTANVGQFLTVNKDAKEPYKATVAAFCLGRSADINKAKRVRQRLNLGPIGWEHEAAVGEQHPQAQQELSWIVNPDAVWVDPVGFRVVSYLYGYPGDRYLILRRAGDTWSSSAWFFGLVPSK